MFIKKIAIIVTVLLCCVTSALAQDYDYAKDSCSIKEKKCFVESCIGGFCLNNDKPINGAWFVNQYGSGYTRNGGWDSQAKEKLNESHCYYVPEQELWVEFYVSYHMESGEIDQIFVTKKSLCDKKYVPKKKFDNFITSRKIGLGSSQDDVSKAYGKPSRVNDLVQQDRDNSTRKEPYKSSEQVSDYGSIALAYWDDVNTLLNSDFYIKDKKVYSISISDSE